MAGQIGGGETNPEFSCQFSEHAAVQSEPVKRNHLDRWLAKRMDPQRPLTRRSFAHGCGGGVYSELRSLQAAAPPSAAKAIKISFFIGAILRLLKTRLPMSQAVGL